MTPNMLKTAVPTIVPIPKSVSVMKVPMTLVKNSGELVPLFSKVIFFLIKHFKNNNNNLVQYRLQR